MESIPNGAMIGVQKNRQKAALAGLCFFLFWSIQMTCKGFGLESGRLYKLLSVVSLGFLGVKLLLTDWSFRELVLSCTIVFFAFLTWELTDMLPLLLLTLALVGMKGISLRKLLTYTFYLRGGIFILFLTAVILGFGTNAVAGNREIFSLYSLLFTGTPFVRIDRYTLGFSTQNIAHLNFFTVVMLYFYVRENRLHPLEYLLLLLANQTLYEWTGSRTSMYLILVAVLLSIVLRVRIFRRPIYAVGQWSYFILLGASVFLALSYVPLWGEPTLWMKICSAIDSLFSSRIRLGNYAITSFPVTLFGRRFATGWSMLDNAYLNFWLRFGILHCILFHYAATAYLIRCAKRDRSAEFLVFVLFALLGFTEMSMYSVTMNVFLLALHCFLFPEPARMYPQDPYRLGDLIQRKKL